MLALPPTIEKPWSLVIYADEVVPGNALSRANLRKVWVAYWSFLELGMAALSQEDAWMCILVLRSDVVQNVAAGMSQIYSALVKMFFGGKGHNPETSGIVIESVGGSQFRMYYKLAMFLQDGDAHKCTWHCKGDAGSKFCMLCTNLFSEKSGIKDEDGTELLTCSIIRKVDLRAASSEGHSWLNCSFGSLQAHRQRRRF